MTCAMGKPFYVINPWSACAAMVTVVGLSLSLSACLAALIQALQATRHPISDTRGYAFEHGCDATYYKLPSVNGVISG